eukprot:Awhi_evm1s4283
MNGDLTNATSSNSQGPVCSDQEINFDEGPSFSTWTYPFFDCWTDEMECFIACCA